MSLSVQIKKEPGTPGGGAGTSGSGTIVDIKQEPLPGQIGSTAKEQLASKVKLAVMQAWRERWTEVQWAIQLKKILAAYSGETVDIAEILMQRALVGNSPVALILSYLKHSVLSQMIPFTTVLKYITEFQDFSRPHCVLALLHLAEMFGAKISFSPCPDSPLQMMRTMLQLIHWLLQALLHCLQRLQTNQVPSEYFVIIDNASRAITNILERGAVRSLLQIARHDSPDLYRDFEQCDMAVRGTLTRLPQTALSDECRNKINMALQLLGQLESVPPTLSPVLVTPHSPCVPVLCGLVALEAALNTHSDTQAFVDQVLMLSRLMKLSMGQMCLEMFRASFMGLLDSGQYTENLQWAIFIFIKLPKILTTIKGQLPDWDISGHVESGISMLMEYSHLLDQTDIKLKDDMLGKFINELNKANILSEPQKQLLTKKRQEQRSLLHQPDLTDTDKTNQTLKRVPAAIGTVNSILKSLEADPLKQSESIVKVLKIMHLRNSFDMLRLAASCNGVLSVFIQSIIKMNDLASQTSGDAVRIPNKNELFDVTFLMIVSVLQQSCVDINEILSTRDSDAAVAVKWARRWLPEEEGRYKNCEISSQEDPEKIDAILSLLLNPNVEIVPQGRIQSWEELIMNLPYALQEVLYALEHKALSMEKVKSIIEHVRHQSTKSLMVVCAAYLSSYMNMVAAGARVKPQAMLEILIAPLPGNGDSPVSVIMDSITFHILPEGHPQRGSRPYLLPSGQLSADTLKETLSASFTRGWLSMGALHTLEQLLAQRGAAWLVRGLVEHLLAQSHVDDVSQSLSLSLAILHLDLERLTIALVSCVMPALLTHPHLQRLTDPRGHCLAKLCVLAITCTHTSKIGQKEAYVRRLHKRTRADTDLDDETEDFEASPTKLRKFSEPQLTFGLEEFNLADALNESDSMPTFNIKEPLNKALAQLFLLMTSILHRPTLTPRTWFIVSFMLEAIKCGGQHTRFILQFMPHNMLSQLMRSLPGVFSDDLILRICDLTSVSGRKIAAKAVCNNTNIPPLEIFD